MSSQTNDQLLGDEPVAICEYCGMPIETPGQPCPALDEGVCEP